MCAGRDPQSDITRYCAKRAEFLILEIWGSLALQALAIAQMA